MHLPLIAVTATTRAAATGPVSRSIDDACGDEPSYLCEEVFDATGGNVTAARLTDFLIDRPLSILLILVIALIAVRLSRRWVDRLVRGIVSPETPPSRRLYIPGMESTRKASDPDAQEREERLRIRRVARAASISAVLTSTISVTIWVVALMLVLSEVGVDLAPLIAGAGIAGVALGFGAQALVKDCISGLFMLLEDQYGIGDIVDLGEATGVVEEVALRTTVLRGVDGTVWHVPNGEVQRVGNQSQHWSTALIDIDVAYDADLAAVTEVMQRTADEVCTRETVSEHILGGAQVLGVEVLGADGITLRMTVTTTPGSQWAVQRELRAALKAAFDDADIDIPFPQRTVWLRNREV